MISAGEVGAVFEIKDEASPVLARMAEEFNRLQGVIDRVKESLSSIGGGISGAGGETVLSGLEKSMQMLIDKGVEVSKSITESFDKLDVAPAIAKVNDLKASLIEAAEAAKGIKISGAGGGSGGGYRGDGGAHEDGGHGGRYGIEHHLMQASNRTGFGIVDAATGIPALGAGLTLYETFKDAFSVAESENNMRLAGVSDDKIKQADLIAGGYSKFGMTKLQALEVIRMASVPLNTGGTGDTGVDAGTAVLPTAAKFTQLARAMKGEEGGDATKQIFELFKADELRNKLTKEEAAKFIEDYAQVYEGTGGKVTPKMFYQGLKYAKSSGVNFSDDFVQHTLPGMELEEGGSTAGTMLMTSASTMLGRRMKKPALAEMDKMGLYNDDHTLKDADLFVQNPFEWMQKDMMPAMLKAGFDTKDKQAEFLERVFNRNTAETHMLLDVNPGNVERTAAAIKRSDSLNDASMKITANDPMAAMAQVQAGLSNLGAAFGGPYVPAITTGLQGLATSLDWLAKKTGPAIDPATGKLMDLSDPHGPLTNAAKWLWNSMGINPAAAGEFHPPTQAAHLGAYDAPAPVHPQDHPAPALPNLSMFAGGPARTPPPAPVTVNSPITAPLTGEVHASFGPITIDNTGLVTTVMKQVQGLIAGLVKGMAAAGTTNSSAGVDGRANPITPDASAAMMGP